MTADVSASSSDSTGDTTADRAALDELFSDAYEELRRLAGQVHADDPAATISPTGLVNEAWLRLRESPGVARTSRVHFARIAARAMRQVLVDAARRRQATKRGGDVLFVTFDEALAIADSTSDEVLVLDEALAELALVSPRQASLVEARFFGGLELQETAVLLEVSESTALRDWRAARAWLTVALQRPR